MKPIDDILYDLVQRMAYVTGSVQLPASSCKQRTHMQVAIGVWRAIV